jgi:LysM repeat protein
MKRILFLLFILCCVFVALPMSVAAESQTWKVRPGDSLDIIATTLEIPKEEIRKLNPGVSESNLQIGQQLKLPLRSYVEGKILEEELGRKDARVANLERKNSDLEKQIATAESQLTWHPIWLWGFWTFLGIISFIASGVYWIFRQTHPRVFKEPHERSIRDLRESQIRTRSSFPYDGEDASIRRGHWQPSLKHVSAHR